MRLSLLGPFRLCAGDGRTVEVGGARLRMVLARLALEADRVVTTGALIDGLWGAQPPSDATNALQSLVSRLRRSLRDGSEPDGLVVSHPSGYRLALAPDDVDVHVFERLAAAGAAELRAGQAAVAAKTLREALDLWRGPALADVAGAPFAEAVAARFAELRLAAVEDRIDADIRRGRHAEVIVELRALTREHPLRERLAALLVKALYLAGRQADALAAYDTVRRALGEELGVDPGAELSEIHLAVLRRDDSVAPAPPTAAGSGRVPAMLTSFVGRQAELAKLTGELARRRLVTLVGPGGAGKTRMAIEASRHAEDVWFVQLAGLREGVDVPFAVLSALGVRESWAMEARAAAGGGLRMPPADVLGRLVGAVAERSCLLVLDNCEHLITAVAELVGVLLDRCPRLRVIATSREPLAITGEFLLPVGPLELPAAEASATVPAGAGGKNEEASAEEAGRAAAVRLFLDRAAAVRPDFELDADRVPAVIDICRRLDGLPLALELAAARLRAMTVGQIAERLDDRFRLLSAGSRTAMPRHRTLGAVVEWSWDLLDERERALARRLAVFPGGATLDGAVEVCSGDGLPGDEVLYVLASLVEKSLVEGTEGGDGQPRYRMLETVRAYGADRLSEAGETDEVHARFVAHHFEVVRTADPLLRGPDQLRWMDRLTAENDNLFAAVRTAVDRGDNATAIGIAAAWAWYWILRGREIIMAGEDERGLPLDRMLDAPGDAPDDALAFLRLMRLFGGKFPDIAELGRILEDCRRSDAMIRFPVLAALEAFAWMFVGDFDRAEEVSRRGLDHPDRWGRGVARIGLTIRAELTGRLEDAERHVEDALREFREIGERWGMAFALNQWADFRVVHGDFARAIEAAEEAMRLVGPVELVERSPVQLSRIAAKRLAAGDLDGAARDYAEALAGCRDSGQPEAEILVRCGLVALARERGDLDEAGRQLGLARAVGLGRRPDGGGDGGGGNIGEPVLLAEASLAVAVGDADRVEQLLRDAITPYGPGSAGWIRELAERVPQVVALRGDLPRAAFLLGASSVVRGALNRGDPDLRRLVARLGDELGEDGYRECFARGAALPRDEARSLLLAAIGSADPFPGSGDGVREGSADPAAVGPHGQREEHRDDAQHPGQRAQQRATDRPAE